MEQRQLAGFTPGNVRQGSMEYQASRMNESSQGSIKRRLIKSTYGNYDAATVNKEKLFRCKHHPDMLNLGNSLLIPQGKLFSLHLNDSRKPQFNTSSVIWTNEAAVRSTLGWNCKITHCSGVFVNEASSCISGPEAVNGTTMVAYLDLSSDLIYSPTPRQVMATFGLQLLLYFLLPSSVCVFPTISESLCLSLPSPALSQRAQPYSAFPDCCLIGAFLPGERW